MPEFSVWYHSLDTKHIDISKYARLPCHLDQGHFIISGITRMCLRAHSFIFLSAWDQAYIPVGQTFFY